MKGCSPMNHKLNLKKQLACIYTNNFFSGLRITDAVWVALLAARGFSLWEIGVAESVFHMVSLTFEVPSGMAADLLGRRKTLVAGGVCMVLSNLLMAFAPDLFFICLAMALSALANAMFSGTASALTYDSLKQCGRTDDYLRVSANCSQLSMLATAVGSLASTLERFLRFSGFYLLSAAFEGTAAAATALMTEPIVTETARPARAAGAGQHHRSSRHPAGCKAHRLCRCPLHPQLPDQDVRPAAARRAGLAHSAAVRADAAERACLHAGR